MAITQTRHGTTGNHVDDKYYQVLAPQSLSERLAIQARDRIYADFMRLCTPRASDKILDLGVSDVINDAANVLERLYPYSSQVTAAGLGAGGQFRKAYPKVTYTQIEANRRLPFADGAFDIAVSNAVLEHVGSRERQRSFVSEMRRVARKVFITVPHRYFPVEHHTAIPLLHFWDAPFAVACGLLGKGEWTDESNLIFMTRERLASAAQDFTQREIGYTGLNLGPFSSNLYLFIDG